MFNKVLFATDFSDSARRAYDTIVEKLVPCGVKEIVVVHIVSRKKVETIANMEGFYSIRIDELRKEALNHLLEKAKGEIEVLVAGLREKGISVQERLYEGIPDAEIVKLADEEKTDLVVMGSHGKGPVQELFLGSVSEKVLRKARCPVLLVK